MTRPAREPRVRGRRIRRADDPDRQRPRWRRHRQGRDADRHRRTLGGDAAPRGSVRALLNGFRRAKLPIVYLTVASEPPDHSDRSPAYRRNAARWAAEGLAIPYAVVGSRAAQVRDEIAPEPNEPILNKVTASGFNSSSLRTVRGNWDADLLVFVGVATNFCVESMLHDAAALGYDCILVEDACTAVDDATHEAGVVSMRPFAEFEGTAALVEALDRCVSASRR